MKDTDFDGDGSARVLLALAVYVLEVFATLGLPIFTGVGIGYWIDTIQNTAPTGSLIGLILGILLGIYFTYRLFRIILARLNKQNKDE